MKKIIAIIHLVLSATIALAQQDSKYFQLFTGDSGYVHEFQEIAPSHSNTYWVGGSKLDWNTVLWSPYIMKINKQEEILVEREFVQSGCSRGILAVLPTDSGFVGAGSVRCGSDMGYPFVDFYDHEGNCTDSIDVQSNGTIPSLYNTIIHSPDGGYLAVGDYILEGNNEWRTTKFNALGMVEWDSIYALPVHSNIIRHALLAPDSSGYYLCGQVDWYPYELPAARGDIGLMKINLDGSIAWFQQYDLGSTDVGVHMEVANDGAILISGYTGPPMNEVAYMIKVDNLGNKQILWQRLYPEGNNSSSLVTHVELADHRIVAVGSSEFLVSEDQSDKGGVIQKMDSLGYVLWRRLYHVPASGFMHNYFYDMTPVTDGGYLIIGRSDYTMESRPGYGMALGWVVRTNCMGLQTEPMASFSTSVDSVNPLSVAFHNQSQYVYPDSIDGGHYLWDFGDGTFSTNVSPNHTYAQVGTYVATLKGVVCNDTSIYQQPVSTWAVGVEGVQLVAGGISVYPNPAHSTLHVQVPATFEHGAISIYSPNGALLATHKLQSGSNTLQLYNLSSGMYYYTISSKQQIVQRDKLIILN